MMCLRSSYKKKIEKNYFFASIKSLKKGVGSGVGSGSISQRYGSADPDPHQNVTDPQHWKIYSLFILPVLYEQISSTVSLISAAKINLPWQYPRESGGQNAAQTQSCWGWRGKIRTGCQTETFPKNIKKKTFKYRYTGAGTPRTFSTARSSTGIFLAMYR